MNNTEHNELSAGINPGDQVEPAATTAERARMLWIAGAIILLDQFSKYIIEATLPIYRSWAPFPSIEQLFRISHTSNTGAAFGLFPSGSAFFLVAAVIVAVALVAYNYVVPAGQFSLRLALGLQLGGALGNWIDRIRIGHVTDFLDFGPWPVFNVADTSIVAGAILLAWLLWQEERQLAATRKTEQLKAQSSLDNVQSIGAEANVIDEWPAN